MEIQWSLVLFTVISGAGAWLFACVGVDEFRQTTKKVAFPASIIAVLLLAAGGISSVTHLSHPERMLSALNHPTSGIFVEALLVGLCAVVAIIYAILLKRNAPVIARRIFAVLGILLAFIFTYACGSSYMMSSQLSWNTYALPLSYMGTAVPVGTSLYLLLCAARKESSEAISLAGILTAVAGVLSLGLGLAYGILGSIALGDYANIYWLGVFVCGGLVPIALGIFAKVKPDSKSILLIALVIVVCAFIGACSLRCLMWLGSDPLMSLFGEVI